MEAAGDGSYKVSIRSIKGTVKETSSKLNVKEVGNSLEISVKEKLSRIAK